MLAILQQYPFLLYLLIAAACLLLPVIVAVALYIIFTGREFSTPLFRFGPKIVNSPEPPPAIQNVIQAGSISPDQMDDLASRIAQKVGEIKAEVKDENPDALYHPNQMTKRVVYIYSAQRDIEGKVAGIVVKYGGAWAGVSLADFDSFFEKTVRFKLIPEDLQMEISDFHFLTLPWKKGQDVPDNVFLDIQYFAYHINQELDYILENTGHNHRPFETEEPREVQG